MVFGDIDSAHSTEELEFGKDGKPLFIAGPFDDPARVRRIQETLGTNAGPAGFDYMIPIGDLDDVASGPAQSPELGYEPESDLPEEP